ncbi:hypothetical protein DSECCO2_646730 [anaerobic digester metagenome]
MLLDSHIGLVPFVMATLTRGVTNGVMLIVILVLVAVPEVRQVAFDVITHETAWPSLILDELYTGEFVPTFTPFTFH